jgi:hypothetical protein
MKGKPNGIVTIYRAVPYVQTNEERISELEAHLRYIHKHSKNPPNIEGHWPQRSQYYNWAYAEIERLKSIPETPANKVKINPGDWVSICKGYAKDHGLSNLQGKFKILSKKVKAQDLHTDGNSWLEWGWNPILKESPTTLKAST